MKLETKYPLLLTTTEPQYLHHHYQDCVTSSDVWTAVYVQGEQLKDDQMQKVTKLAARRNVDERGLGWKDTESCWISRDGKTLLVAPDAEPVPAVAPQERGLTSASGRFRWTVQQGCDQPTRLQQLDYTTGQTTTVWEHSTWAGLSVAADPVEDRLLWSYRGYHLDSELLSWNPQSQQTEVVPTPFRKDFEYLTFSPDGKTLAFVHANEVYTHRLDQSETHQVSDLEMEGDDLLGETYRMNPGWSPDGKRLFYNNFSFYMVEDELHESYNLMAALPDGSERKILLDWPAISGFQVGPQLT